MNARVLAPAAPVTLDDKGDVSWKPREVGGIRVRAAQAGRRLRRSAAAEAIAAAVREGRHTAALSASPVSPEITAEGVGRTRRLIGTFTTRFGCCEPRVVNIRRIARSVDGTVVPAGGEFSLNRVAGPRTRAKGYVPAPFIADGKIKPSVGGGVSQFSTTIYNAAYFAGLDLGAHQPHSFYIDRYPAGREATLDYASIDLTWTNDTEVPILVRASTSPTSVTVSLYGDNGGRRVRATSRSRQRTPGRDFAITVIRSVTYPDGRSAREPYTTTYDRPPPPD